MKHKELIPHLFRTEYGKMLSVLTRRFGIENVELAEDILSETFMTALNIWPYQGVPDNPIAWLYQVSKNKFRNELNRNNLFKTKISNEFFRTDLADEYCLDFSEKNIMDSQLRMLFTLCHPSLAPESQICLSLRILCGLGLQEIADAFFTNKETIHKRIQRAKQKLRKDGIKLEVPDEPKLSNRLDSVLTTIYLLFSEGYFSETHDSIIRKDLCVEALNLNYLLLRYPATDTHSTNALMSLMCFQASRLEARQTGNGNIVLYDDQNRALWDQEFIEKGFYYLQKACAWEINSAYYLEACIAYWYTVSDENPDKWLNILKAYDALIKFRYSSIAALNRIWAFSKIYGNTAALGELEKWNGEKTHFFFLLKSELVREGNVGLSIQLLEKAFELSKNATEKQMIQNRILKYQKTL